MRVILFPIWIVYEVKTRVKDARYKNLCFSKETCKEYLDKIMPLMVSTYCEDTNEFLISNSDDVGDIEFSDFWNARKLKKKYKQFFLKFYSQCEEYILNEYNIDGYSKMLLLNYIDWKNAKTKFGWSVSYNADYKKGVIFYIEH